MAAPSEAAVLAAQVDILAIALAWAMKVADHTCLAAHRTSRQAAADNDDDLEAARRDEAPRAKHHVVGNCCCANLLEGGRRDEAPRARHHVVDNCCCANLREGGHGNQVSDSVARASPQEAGCETMACPCHLERRSLYASNHDCGSYRFFCAGRHPHHDAFCDDGHDRPPVLPPSSRALSFGKGEAAYRCRPNGYANVANKVLELDATELA